MNPSICLGLYLDNNRKSPPIIEMFYLTNRYGRQAGMHFDKFIPQILPKRQLPTNPLGRKIYSAGMALGLDRKQGRQGVSVFDGYVSGRVESMVEGVKSSAKRIPVGTYSTWIQTVSGIDDMTPGGAAMPDKKQNGAGDVANDAAGILPAQPFGTIKGILDLIENGPSFSSATAKLTGDLLIQLRHIWVQAKEEQNPVAGEALNYIKAQAQLLADHIAHPEDVINMGREIQSLVDQIEYLSFSLEDVRILTIDIEKPPAQHLTKNPYNFDHDFKIFGQLWGWSENGEVADLMWLDQQALEDFGFGKAPEEFRNYQALMPKNVREYQLKGNILPAMNSEGSFSKGPSGP
ncbi:hypothetical protein [Marinobacter sp.]|uniref:hypothetical protein n=1 Tax=Marinobacter sp. TaxID=50741 RepID=UPI0035629D2B